jgi:hypothetical protein
MHTPTPGASTVSPESLPAPAFPSRRQPGSRAAAAYIARAGRRPRAGEDPVFLAVAQGRARQGTLLSQVTRVAIFDLNCNI